jgi:hypothetical protein
MYQRRRHVFLVKSHFHPPGTLPSLPSSLLVEAMDSTPGSAKRSRPTDSLAKGQPKVKIAAQLVIPEDQADSYPDMEAIKRVKRPPGPLQWEEEKKAIQAQIHHLQYQVKSQTAFIKVQAEEFQAAFLQIDTKFSAALEQKSSTSSSMSTTPSWPTPKSISNSLKEVEFRVVKQITNMTAKVIACESRVSSNEQRFAAMDESFQELLRETVNNFFLILSKDVGHEWQLP